MTRRVTERRSILAAGGLCLLACGGGGSTGPTPPPPPPPPPGALPSVAVREVLDVENFADGRDLSVEFGRVNDESRVAEYRVLVAPENAAAGLDLAAAAALAVDRVTSVSPTGTDQTIRLDSGSLDTGGEPIGEGTPYVVLVHAVSSVAGVDGSLSAPSSSITLAQTDLVRTLTEPIDAGSGGMAVDAQGNIYSADFGASLSGPPGTEVYRITPTGEVTVFATGLVGASGNAFDSNGNLFQSNIGADRVSRIDPDGTVTTFVTEGISNPVGIAIDENDDLYVANCGDNTIRHVTSGGTSTHFAGGPMLNCPNGIALASDGNLYVANFGNGNVIRIAPDGAMSQFAVVPGGNNGHITFANGVLYVVARAANQIYRLELDGTLTLLAGTGERGRTDGAALTSRLSLTNDIAVSPDGGTLYFNDVVGGTDFNVISPVVIRSLELLPDS
ncbi:MAG: hypothetical protein R3195_18560 [Gemmatimonadota bacterium]|nr:hypothetical protein [Gemmatimonadota bacterium]